MCWGSNLRGEIGLPPGNPSAAVQVAGLPADIVAITAGASHTCALGKRGHAWCWGWNYQGQLGNRTFTDTHVPQPVFAISGAIRELAAGGEQTCARVANKDVMCWGSNYFGEAGRSNRRASADPVEVVAE